MSDTIEMEEKPKWYVLQTLSGYEHLARTNLLTMVENNDLGNSIYDIVVPEYEDIVEKNGKKKVVMRRKFPCYIFIKMIYSKHVWFMVTNTRGVTCFCGPKGRPLAMTSDEVKRNELEKITESEFEISVKDTVEVLSGALTGFIGDVLEINFNDQKVKVSVSMFGRDTPVDLGFTEVRKVAKA